jgi:NAD(P)-dependent dehydrogenase (short-subunit alcohol dehydrogenase family)
MDTVFSLRNKLILITGASSGIGRSIAIECSIAGARLIITGRNIDRLNETKAMLTNGSHSIIQADLNIEEDIKQLIEKMPEIDGVVHCAGINTKSPIKFLNEEKIESVMKTNFYAPVLLMKAIIKNKKIRKNGSVVMISSIASQFAAISNAVYSASKGAVDSFVRVLALELAPQNIRVNGIKPGMIKTGILEAYDLLENLKEFEKEYPLGRFGKPEDIAYAAIFLLSDATAWITGSSLIVDGGITLR